MPLDPRQLATDLLNSASQGGDFLTVSLDIGRWSSETVRETVDYVLADCGAFNLRLIEMSTDAAGFTKFSIPMSRVNCGFYQGIPVLIDKEHAGTLELVFEPEKRAA